MRVFFLFIFVGFSCWVFGEDEKQVLKTIKLFQELKDFTSLSTVTKNALKKFPNSKEIQKAALIAEIYEKDEREVLSKVQEFEKHFGRDLEILEILAWQVLERAKSSLQYNIRLHALVGAALTHDAKALPWILSLMEDSNAFIRSTAIQLAADWQDECIKKKILERLQKENLWEVRLKLLQTISKMRMKEAKNALNQLLDSSDCIEEEKILAWQALVNISEKLSLDQLTKLFLSKRAYLRTVACEICFLNDFLGLKNELVASLNDPNFEVKIAAIYALGIDFFDPMTDLEKISPFLKDPNPEVAIGAARLLYHYQKEEVQTLFSKWIEDPSEKIRSLATMALTSSGEEAAPFCFNLMQKVKDPFIRLNLAIGLLTNQVEVAKDCDIIYLFLKENKEKLMITDHPHLRAFFVQPSKIRHLSTQPALPESVDLYIRLKLASLLAFNGDQRACKVVESNLKALNGSITDLATLLLLQEGEEGSFAYVKDLLLDKDIRVKIPAAWVLALFAKDSSAIPTLVESYSVATYLQKIQIIEAMGAVADENYFSFFLEGMKEPFQILRLVAASSLLRSLYH